MLPATFLVTIVLMAVVIGGLAVIWRVLRSGGSDDVQLGTETPCPHCKLLNPTHAKFCGHCGKRTTV